MQNAHINYKRRRILTNPELEPNLPPTLYHSPILKDRNLVPVEFSELSFFIHEGCPIIAHEP
jgi:hypothetical protein